MPKTSPELAQAKAARVVKSLKKNNISLTETAKDLGVSPQAIQNQLDRNPYVKNLLQKFYEKLDKAGATDEKSARVISEAMDAEKEVFNDDGQIVGTSKDHATRLKANDQLLKLKRYIGDTDTPNITNVGEMKVIIVNGTGDQTTSLRSA